MPLFGYLAYKKYIYSLEGILMRDTLSITNVPSARTVIDIHFFSDSIIDILFFDSDYFDSILKNCTNRIFSHVPQHSCGKDTKILTMQGQ